MTPDNDLLRQYVDTGSEAAFAELVRRYVGLAYAAALRQVGAETALAEDVAQSVFIDLARKAKQLTSHATLAGWIHTSVRYAALRALRDHRRRQARELEALAMTDDAPTPELHWEQLRPTLDAAVASLDERDREAVLLRYFQGWTHREVAAALAVNEDAARMRVERALDKLRLYFARHGVTTTAALLAMTLGALAATPAPAAFAAHVTGNSLLGAPAAGGATGLRALLAHKIGLALGAVTVMMIVGIILWQEESSSPPAAPVAAMAPVPPVPPTPAPAAVSPPSIPAVSAAPPPVVSVAPPLAPAPLPAAAPAPAPAFAPTSTLATAPPVSPAVAALVAANNRFAFELFRQSQNRPGENVLFSPYSVSTALGMLWLGSRGDTARQLAAAAQLASLPAADVAPAFESWRGGLAQLQERTGAQFITANSLWPEQDQEHPLLPEFLNTVQRDFGAGVYLVDFHGNPAGALQQINAWVAGQTQDQIKDLLPSNALDTRTRLVLLNSVYLRAQWGVPFRGNNSLPDEFRLPDGGRRPIVLMRGTQQARYAEVTAGAQSLQIVALNYGRSPAGTGLSFVILLPPEPEGLPALEREISPDKLAGWLAALANAPVQVLLPKLNLEERLPLDDLLRTLGVSQAFLDPLLLPEDAQRADFSGMNGARTLFLNKAFHLTRLVLNETGTEAAPATAPPESFGAPSPGGSGGGRGAGGAPGPRGAAPGAGGVGPKIVRADRPFLYLIRDDATGGILFLGRLAEPPPPSAADLTAANANATRRGRGPGRGGRRNPGQGAVPSTNSSPPPATAPGSGTEANAP